MAEWQFIARTRGGVALADLSPYLRQRNITLSLNRPHRVTGALHIDSPHVSLDFLKSGVHELEVKRNNENVGGIYRLVDVGVALNRKGGGVLSLEWECIRTYLRQINVAPATALNKAQSEHAWDLINAAQGKTGAAYGITRGLIPTTDPVKDRTYDSEVDTLTAIEELADRDDGFDFDFNADRQFDCYYPRKGSASSVATFQWPNNLWEMSYSISAKPGMLLSDVTVKDGDVTSATAASSATRSEYGRYEGVLSLPDLDESAAVIQEYANAYVAAHANPIFLPEIVIDPTHEKNPWGSYGLGDTITIQAKAGAQDYVDIDTDVRILDIGIALSEQDSEGIKLTVDSLLPVRLDRDALMFKKSNNQTSATNIAGARSVEDKIAALERFVQ